MASFPLATSKGSQPNSFGRIQRTPAAAAAEMRLCWISGGVDIFKVIISTSWPRRACMRESWLL